MLVSHAPHLLIVGGARETFVLRIPVVWGARCLVPARAA